MRIHRIHFRELGHCNKGTRSLAESHGIDWWQLCGEGVDEEFILATMDDRAINVVEYARKRGEINGQR